jgi:hypothetical protein
MRGERSGEARTVVEQQRHRLGLVGEQRARAGRQNRPELRRLLEHALAQHDRLQRPPPAEQTEALAPVGGSEQGHQSRGRNGADRDAGQPVAGSGDRLVHAGMGYSN